MFKSILVAVDVAHVSSWQFAIPEALELARSGKSRVTVMTVVREIKSMFEGIYFGFQSEQLIVDARNKLASIVHNFQAVGVSIEEEVRCGSIGHEILASADERGVDLIVMASHRPEILDYLIGPNAAHVAQHASCSVLVLRRFG